MIFTIVQAVPGREKAHARTRKSIKASDIVRTDYRWHEQPEGCAPRDHFLDTMSLASAQTAADLVLRLEDDAIVNEHILHNIETWPALQEPDFGAGWLFDPIGVPGRWDSVELHGSVGVVFKRKFIPELIDRCKWWFDRKEGRLGQDIAMSRSVWFAEKRVFMHDPPLVEHPLDVPSTLSHVHTESDATSRGRFDGTWKRSEVVSVLPP